MTTAHRATYKPARGATASAGRSLVRSAAVSGRDGVNHTVLKKRDRLLPLGASLDSDEEAGAGGDAAVTGAIGGLVDVGGGTGAGAPLRRRKRPALPPPTAAAEVAAAAARYADADADGDVSDGNDDDDDDDSDDDDDDDDDAELLRELELIKAERAAERARAAAEADADGDGGDGDGGSSAGGLLGDNPLLADTASVAASDAGTAATAYRVQRRWDDDLVFRHQTRGQAPPVKRFINDTVRNDFHRRFLDKYIR